MSEMKTCDCGRENYRVLHRNHNHSYFEYPQGGEHYSDYSGIICLKCGWHFRSKAKWVEGCPDISSSELKKMGY